MMRVGVVIPAGGRGERMGGRPKPFLVLGGEFILKRALIPFLGRSDVVQIVIALPAGHDQVPEWLQHKRIKIVAGGRERMDSVRAGITALDPSCELVVIHDAARPLVTTEVIDRVINTAAQGFGATAALPALDTIHEVDDEYNILSTPERGHLWQAQTPQAFPRAMIVNAHQRAHAEGIQGTDDAALVVRYGGAVKTVPGDPANLKITRMEDLPAAEALLAARPFHDSAL